ncbi:AraC family transcriptional regulator [Amycolatopsis mongoliensis]|uniref:AraC family transcriptional regulator n=1 Tax=Amycolatopsis mongoliensis TaxID=715475 RepID=A0A9Y2JN91_9PSEU|nr:AraC family transcriptional regulator [Amycolatopsis sp. 4-36]WIY01148.1 AraC family transcriptional regulator [Amycolatopsis sp. 4-36]
MAAIRHMTYQPLDRGASSVEVMTFERLRETNNGGTQRADFHVLALVDDGDGAVTVDFVSHSLSARTAVWIPPGAVHRWDDTARITGHLVLFVPTAPVTRRTRELVASPDLVARWPVPAEAWPFVDAARGHLVLEAAASAEDPSTELPEILLSALLIRVEPPRSEARSGNPTFQLFRSSVEAHFRTHHDAGFYAAKLGFAPRTLTRAVQQVTGRTAKAYIVERIVLEAKRLLAHDRLTAARCASELGFPDPSNFSLFFRNATGVRPGAWQAATILD